MPVTGRSAPADRESRQHPTVIEQSRALLAAAHTLCRADDRVDPLRSALIEAEDITTRRINPVDRPSV